MSGFVKHNIRHLSPSSLNLFHAEPAFWVLKYLYGHRDQAGPAAHRGTAVEAGLDALWVGATLPEAILAAEKNFELNLQGELSDAIDDERDAIGHMLTQAAGATKSLDKPVSKQVRVEAQVEGVDVPIMGYIDYLMPNYLIDLKTTHRLPSEPKPEHLRQVALYSACKGIPAKLLYVTTKKHAVYSPSKQDLDAAYRQLCRIARSVAKTLDVSATREEVAEFFTPNLDSFYWKDEASKVKASEVY